MNGQELKNEIRNFFITRRSKIMPDMAGLRIFDENRRVVGLRREEVAALAGISVDYYKRIERGNIGNISEGVFNGLVYALQLDEASCDYLQKLIFASHQSNAHIRSTSPQQVVRHSVRRILAMMPSPSCIRNNRFDILDINDLGRMLYAPLYDFCADQTPNIARFLFMSDAASEFYIDYEETIILFASVLRYEQGRTPHDEALNLLIDELKDSSPAFIQAWGAGEVRYQCNGMKRIHHPLVGNLEFDFETFELPNDPGQRLMNFSCEPDSETALALESLEVLSENS